MHHFNMHTQQFHEHNFSQYIQQTHQMQSLKKKTENSRMAIGNYLLNNFNN